jgi:PII-like signaling protein
VLLAEPSEPPVAEEDGLAYWRKLSVYAGEQTRHDGEPLYSALVRRLRAEGAAGATVLRGLWGFHGEHRPHGEHLWSIRRRVPVLTTVLDTPANARRWFEVIDAMTQRAGLVTSELVPALRARGHGLEHGGLELARAASRARRGSPPQPGGAVPPHEPYSDQ